LIRRRHLGAWIARGVAVFACALHSWWIWTALGGWTGIASPWPLAKHDHPLYFHSALVTRHFLRQSWTTAGYDPSFMSGYAKSIIWPTSSTLPELVLFFSGGADPARTYKLYVLAAAALGPWLVAVAGLIARARAGAITGSVVLFVVYAWTDFPINYVGFGMLPYFLAIPVALAATLALARYLDRGGMGWWVGSAVGLGLALMVHPTTVMIVVPAGALPYGVAIRRARRDGLSMRAGRHAGVWLLVVVALAVNAFWWWPGIWLASTKGPSDIAFFHPEPVWDRLRQIVESAPSIEAMLWALAPIGLVALARRDPVSAAGLVGFLGAGFAWGYLAGFSRSLDALQPGRHTYALYAAAALAAGIGAAEIVNRVGRRGRFAGWWAPVAFLLVGLRLFGPALEGSIRARLQGPEPFLSSRPSPRLIWLVDRLKRHVRPGERILYEEGGKAPPGQSDPLEGDRLSGLLPHLAGVEVIGGPYLHASLTTNFTQFGEGKLFGETGWDRDRFLRYARLYRPSAIVCWSRRARAFCRANPDLIEILADQRTLLLGRVRGVGGAAIRGEAEVEATPGRLVVRGASAELDGPVVLRYHSLPYLRSRPPSQTDPVMLEDDPVPFIGLRPGPGPVTLELDLPP
jgi:hypothetical protein